MNDDDQGACKDGRNPVASAQIIATLLALFARLTAIAIATSVKHKKDANSTMLLASFALS